jgi:hypothetical protein
MDRIATRGHLGGRRSLRFNTRGAIGQLLPIGAAPPDGVDETLTSGAFCCDGSVVKVV